MTVKTRNIEPEVHVVILEKELEEANKKIFDLSCEIRKLNEKLNLLNDDFRQTIKSKSSQIQYLQSLLSCYRDEFPDFYPEEFFRSEDRY